MQAASATGARTVDVNKIVRAVATLRPGLAASGHSQGRTKTNRRPLRRRDDQGLDNLSTKTSPCSSPRTGVSRSRPGPFALHPKEVATRNPLLSSRSPRATARLIAEKVATFVTANARKLNNAIVNDRNDLYEYSASHGVRPYLLKNRSRRESSRPAYFTSAVASAWRDQRGHRYHSSLPSSTCFHADAFQSARASADSSATCLDPDRRSRVHLQE